MLTWGSSAAGLLIRDRGRVLMQQRALGVQYPGTWSIPGGAVAGNESPADAALRETREETGLRLRDVHLTGLSHVAEPVAGWTYTTVLARLRKRARGVQLRPSWEASRHEWVGIEDVDTLPLHRGFAASWPEVRPLLRKPVRVLFVCLGNVCRSPLAEVLLRRMAVEAGAPILVASAGTWAEVRQSMYPATAECATRHGLDGSAHVSRQLVHADIAAHDIVVTLDAMAGEVVQTIADRLDNPPTILVRPALNPWGMDDDAHELAYRQIAATCADVLALARLDGVGSSTAAALQTIPKPATATGSGMSEGSPKVQDGRGMRQ
jgi:protein-tyrosine-phosphatase/8-oxo-dGTP pyrophosphatase MutT (NUDIX family)